MPRERPQRALTIPLIGLVSAVMLAVLSPLAAAAQSGLRLEVLRGEGSNNNALHGPSISSAVRVLDAGGRPLAGTLVVFSPPEAGASVVFSGFEVEANAITDESGVAVAPRVRPVSGNGPVEIQVLATHAGEFANCVIHQMNLGLGGEAAWEHELDVVRLPASKLEGHKPISAEDFSVRMEDSKGNAVPSAEVLFVLRRVGNRGHTEEISRTTVTANQDGEATVTVPKKAGNTELEFLVVARGNGRRATRYFKID